MIPHAKEAARELYFRGATTSGTINDRTTAGRDSKKRVGEATGGVEVWNTALRMGGKKDRGGGGRSVPRHTEKRAACRVANAKASMRARSATNAGVSRRRHTAEGMPGARRASYFQPPESTTAGHLPESGSAPETKAHRQTRTTRRPSGLGLGR